MFVLLRGLVVVIAAALIATACGGDTSAVATVESAGDAIEIPAGFDLAESETLEGLESTDRRLVFSTELSQQAACDLAAEMLTTWADAPVNEPTQALPLTWCRFEVNNPSSHDRINVAVARIERAKVDDVFIDDVDATGGVSRVVVFFRQDV